MSETFIAHQRGGEMEEEVIKETFKVPHKRRERVEAILYSLLWALFWVFTRLVCRYRVSGREHVPTIGPLLIVANHLSWYDPMLFGVILPRRLWFFTKIEVFRWPVIGWLARHTGQIAVQRGMSDRAAIEQALEYLREGKVLVIFPEG